MFRAEVGQELSETIAPAEVSRQNQILNNQQKWLLNQHAFLLGRAKAEVSLSAGTQYYTFPESSIDIDRVEKNAFVLWGGTRYPLRFGITPAEYNTFDSDLDERSVPAMAWDLVDVSGSLQIEIWPIPSDSQTLLLAGVKPITTMSADADVCVIDDMPLVLFSAAEYLARIGARDAQAKLVKAQSALNSLRASRNSRYEAFNLSGGSCSCIDRRYASKGITGSSAGGIIGEDQFIIGNE